jgi:N,N'-diacetyllegionaminate synthase
MSKPGKVRLVAEAAQGFEGDPTLARLLVRAAAAAGADMIKFQLVYADELARPDYPYYQLYRGLEMPAAAWEQSATEAARRDIDLAFDVFGPRSIEVAAGLGARAVKLHVSDFFNRDLLDAALAAVPEVFFSVGGIRVEEIASLLDRYPSDPRSRLTMLVGFQAEPTPIHLNHLARLGIFRERFPGLRLGFMDHSDASGDEGGWLGALALPYGVELIEKHITVERMLELEDYVSALGPMDFAGYVKRVRAAEAAIGGSSLALTAEEEAYRSRSLKVVVAAHHLSAGRALTASDLDLLRVPARPGREVLHRADEVVGRTLAVAVDAGEPIDSEVLS